MADERLHLAAFDFDGTLTVGDSVVPFARRVLRLRQVAAFGRALPQLAGSLARRDRDRFRAAATAAVFRGLRYDAVRAAAEVYGREVLPSRLRADTVAMLERHRAGGAAIVIVSASYREYLEPIAELLGVDDVLATELEVADGICTGRLVGGNCRGPQKVARLEAWLSSRGLARSDVTATAYGDSTGDREMLAWADQAVWVQSVES